MFVLCPKCWNELNTSPVDCPCCGTSVDVSTPRYMRHLLAAIAHANSDKRTRICWVLASIGDRNAVPILVELLHDPELFVRIAALRALGEIGDPASLGAVEKLTLGQNLVVRTVARSVLKLLVEHPGGSAHTAVQETKADGARDAGATVGSREVA
jgi:HEAT repeat protein